MYKSEVNMKKIDTLLFDLDGTLLDTSADLAESVNYALDEFGYDKKNLLQIISYLGNGIENLIRLSLPDGADTDIKEILSVFREYYFENIAVHTKPYNHIIEVLEHFKKKGYKIAIISNKFDDGVQKLCDKFDLYDYILSAIGENSHLRRKPAPDMIDYTLSKIGSVPSKSIYIGDSEVDIKTASNSHMKCIAVTWGFRGKDDIAKLSPDYIADTPKDIIEIVEKINNSVK